MQWDEIRMPTSRWEATRGRASAIRQGRVVGPIGQQVVISLSDGRGVESVSLLSAVPHLVDGRPVASDAPASGRCVVVPGSGVTLRFVVIGGADWLFPHGRPGLGAAASMGLATNSLEVEYGTGPALAIESAWVGFGLRDAAGGAFLPTRRTHSAVTRRSAAWGGFGTEVHRERGYGLA